jgi:hypothetical protein
MQIGWMVVHPLLVTIYELSDRIMTQLLNSHEFFRLSEFDLWKCEKASRLRETSPHYLRWFANRWFVAAKEARSVGRLNKLSCEFNLVVIAA